MRKLSGESLNIKDESIQALSRLFPEAVAEGKVNFNVLRQLLGDLVDAEQERYSFTWNGKSDALRISQTPSLGSLRPCKEESKNWDTTRNIYIEGDNLEVLKLLQKSYYGKVKMIYIDPPYNTGNDLVYRDNFKDSIDNYKNITGQIDGNRHNIATNTESNGRFHTDWLNMIYPRLRLARNLLTEDGVIFISIDDHEQANLKKVCDEIFGENNLVENIIWKKRYGGGAKEKYLVSLQEYILMYCKNIENLNEIFIPLSEESAKKYYSKRDEKFNQRGGYRTHPLEAGKAMDARPNLIYPIPAPDGSLIMPKRQWLWAKERAYAALENNELEIIYGNDGEWVVSSKQYLKDTYGNTRLGKVFSIIDNVFTQHGTNEMISILGNAKIFSYPKPSELIKILLQLATEEESIVMDFFSGSATTAHAVMQLNAEDGGNRKFIMVQIPELTPEDSETAKAGYKNICEIGKERIRRAGEKIKAEAGDKAPDLDIGFKVFKLDTSNLKKWNDQSEDLMQSLLESVDNFLPGRTQLDVVYEILLKMGIELSTEIEEREVVGEKIYVMDGGALMICLGENITLSIADEMIKIHKEYNSELWQVVFHDVGFASDMDKTNIKETLKTAGLKEDNFVCI